MNFSDLPPFLERLELEEKKEVEFEWIWKEKINLITPNSLLIDAKRHWQHFKNWFDGQDFELKLLFRGSQHDFNSNKFENLVGYKEPTLHIIKSEHNYLFGGCTFVSYPQRYVHKSRTKNIYIEPN